MGESLKKCLNCGLESDGRYCPSCGQSLAATRFNMRRLAIHTLSSLTRVSGDFICTAAGLIVHPWKIVRDYVLGKRVGIISPVSMLLLLALYWGLLMAFVPHFNQSQHMDSLRVSAIIKWLYGSLTFQYLFLAVPVAFGTWTVYAKDMRGRFNFAELLIATLYLASTFLLVNLLLAPLELLNEKLANVLLVIITAAYGIVSIMKAFPQKSRGIVILKLSLWMIICGMMLTVFLMLLALPMYRDFI